MSLALSLTLVIEIFPTKQQERAEEEMVIYYIVIAIGT